MTQEITSVTKHLQKISSEEIHHRYMPQAETEESLVAIPLHIMTDEIYRKNTQQIVSL